MGRQWCIESVAAKLVGRFDWGRQSPSLIIPLPHFPVLTTSTTPSLLTILLGVSIATQFQVLPFGAVSVTNFEKVGRVSGIETPSITE